MWVGKTRVEQMGQVSRRKRMGMGKQVDITETESKTDKSHRDTNVKGNRHRIMDQIRKRIVEIDSMHGEQGQDGQEPWGDDAECGKSHGLRRMSQHSLECYGMYSEQQNRSNVTWVAKK